MKFFIRHSNKKPELMLIDNNFIVGLIFRTLQKFDLLNDKFDFLCKPGSVFHIESLKILPFLFYADTIETKTICTNCKNIKMLKARTHNYYCDTYMKNIISVFGNKKSWEEFNITKLWKPRIVYLKTKDSYGSIFPIQTNLLNLTRYKKSYSIHGYLFQSFIYWSDNSISVSQTYNKLKSANLIYTTQKEDLFVFDKLKYNTICYELRRPEMRSRRKLSMLINQQKYSPSVNRIIKKLNSVKSVLSEDGQKLLSDLFFVKNIK